MAQPAIFNEALDARLVSGVVIHADKDRFKVLAGNRAYASCLAASCFLTPREQDTVLTALLEDGTSVILSVLFRQEAPAQLRLPENSTVHCEKSLTLRSGSSLALQSAGALSLASEEVHVSAKAASANILKVHTVCDTAELCCRALTSLGQTALSVFHSFTQCLGESRKMVEGTDETRCASSTLLAEENATVMSTNSLTLVKETSRTDAKLIQLG